MLTGINHITWDVQDIGEAFHFYVEVLGFQPIMRSSRSAYFTVGGLWLAVVLGVRRTDKRYEHIAFSVEPENYEAMVKALRSYGVQSWQENCTEGASFYFLDPSGNKFELHSSDIHARIRHGKAHWGEDVNWYI